MSGIHSSWSVLLEDMNEISPQSQDHHSYQKLKGSSSPHVPASDDEPQMLVGSSPVSDVSPRHFLALGDAHMGWLSSFLEPFFSSKFGRQSLEHLKFAWLCLLVLFTVVGILNIHQKVSFLLEKVCSSVAGAICT